MGKIRNFNELATTELRHSALLIAEAGLLAIDTKEAIRRAVKIRGEKLFINEREFELGSIKNLYVVGVGKCSLEAGMALEEVLGDRITDGIVVYPVRSSPPQGPSGARLRAGATSNGMDVHKGTLKKIKTYQGTHPLPTEQNIDATKQIIELLDGCEENDLVIFAISGGGSTLLCLPANNHTCAEEARVFTCLSDAGATIQELNTVRKHISLARGGFLAKYVYPARAVALIFSDVPGNNLEFVSSGPTVKDTTTVADAEKIIEKYNIVRCVIRENPCVNPRKSAQVERCTLNLIETPKEDKYFEKVVNIMIVSNEVALRAMADESRRLGFSPEIVTAVMSGEAKDKGLEISEKLNKSKSKTALLYGGETTVDIKGSGRGGRNLELALSALRKTKERELILTLASDGRDNGEFAGAICDTITKEAVGKAGFNVETELKNNNSYPVFEKAGNYLLTGDTGSNVSDLVIVMKG